MKKRRRNAGRACGQATESAGTIWNWQRFSQIVELRMRIDEKKWPLLHVLCFKASQGQRTIQGEINIVPPKEQNREPQGIAIVLSSPPILPRQSLRAPDSGRP
jgi:hypothetical protein